MTAGDRSRHEAECVYRPADCPLGCAEPLRHHQLQEHVGECEMGMGALDSSSAAPARPPAALPAGEETLKCPVPGCGLYPMRLVGVHDDAHLRSHMQALAAFKGDWNSVQAQVRKVLVQALEMWKPDVCQLCKDADGDTIECRVCERFIHEDCDPGYMLRSCCADCHSANEELHGMPRPRDVMDADADEDDEDDDDDEDDEEECDLSGFVVDDDVVIFSSGEDGLADDEPSYRSSASPRLMAAKKLKKKRRKAFVVESSDGGSGKKSARKRDDNDDDELVLQMESSAEPGIETVEKKKKKKHKKQKKQHTNSNAVAGDIDLVSPVRKFTLPNDSDSGEKSKKKREKKKKKIVYLSDDD